MRNFHLPLPDEVYEGLRQEAVRSSRPATALARQAIELWLKHRRKAARHEAIAAFAAQHAGSSLDLDADLEAASTEGLARLRVERRRAAGGALQRCRATAIDLE